MNEEIKKGTISYNDLRLIIFNYFKEFENKDLASMSIDHLKDKLAGHGTEYPFFEMRYSTRKIGFDLSKEDIKKILTLYVASKKGELCDVIFENVVNVSYKDNPNIDFKKEKPLDLDITYNVSIDYNELRKIIFDYYKKNKGINLESISIDYLKHKLKDNADLQPFFVMHENGQEKRFDISKEEIHEILNSYFKEKNCELKNINYDYDIDLYYKKQKNIIDEFGEINRSGQEDIYSHNNVPVFEPPKEEQQNNELNNNTLEDLARMTRENRKFTILQRERAMNDAQKAKNKAALMAGLCILGVVATTHYNLQDMSMVIQQELNAMYSWDALKEYIKDIGPLTTLLTGAAIKFTSKYLKHSKKLNQLHNEFIDFNASLENNNNLGGNNNAKTR